MLSLAQCGLGLPDLPTRKKLWQAQAWPFLSLAFIADASRECFAHDRIMDCIMIASCFDETCLRRWLLGIWKP